METFSIIISVIIAIEFVLIWDLVIEFFEIFTGSYKNKEMSTYVTLDDFFNEDRKAIKQVVYKVEGDFNGDIKGDNVTVILMGDGDINGDINTKDGEVVLIKGSINGDVKADKIVCPTKPTTEDKDQYICKEEHNGTPPEKKIEYVHNCKLATKYDACQIVHVKCPNCGKHFAKQLRVQTTFLDGVITEMNVEEMRHDY